MRTPALLLCPLLTATDAGTLTVIPPLFLLYVFTILSQLCASLSSGSHSTAY